MFPTVVKSFGWVTKAGVQVPHGYDCGVEVLKSARHLDTALADFAGLEEEEEVAGVDCEADEEEKVADPGADPPESLPAASAPPFRSKPTQRPIIIPRRASTKSTRQI